MQRLDHRTVEIALTEIWASITSLIFTRCGANGLISFIRRANEAQCFGINQIETISQIKNSTNDSRGLDLAAASSFLFFRPVQRTSGAIFPKISSMSQPVPRILTAPHLFLTGNNLLGERQIAPVITQHQRT